MDKTYILGQGYVEHELVPWNRVQTLQQFYDRMKAYDWTTCMSDSHAVWARGEKEWKDFFEPCLKRMEEIHGQKAMNLFEAMREWAWGNGPLPMRPEK